MEDYSNKRIATTQLDDTPTKKTRPEEIHPLFSKLIARGGVDIQPSGREITLLECVPYETVRALRGCGDLCTQDRNHLKGMLKNGTMEEISSAHDEKIKLLLYYVKYEFSAKEASEMARLYPEGHGLTKLTRNLRNVLCNEMQIQDVDMVLAFLAIFAGLCEHHRVDCPSALTRVLGNRETFYATVASEMIPPETDMKRVKQKTNAVFHLGSPGNSSTLKRFKREMTAAVNDLKDTGDCDILEAWEIAEKSSKGKRAGLWVLPNGTKIEAGNVLGKFVARLAQQNERRMVTKMMELVHQSGFTVITYEYDGMKLYNRLDNRLTQEKLDEITSQLKEHADFKSIARHVEFLIKPMEVGDEMKRIVAKATATKGLVTYSFETIPTIKYQVDDQKDAAEHFLENFGHQLKCCLGELYWRDGSSMVWKPLSGKINENLINNWVSKIDYFMVSERGQEKIISRFLKGRNDIAQMVKDLAAELCRDDKLLIQCEASTIGKICFQNGVYCFKTKGFHEWCPELLNEVHSLKMIPRDFPQAVEQEAVSALQKELFDNMFVSSTLEDAAAMEATREELPEEICDIGENDGNCTVPETAISRRNDLLEQSKLLVARIARGMAGYGQIDKIGSACIGARNSQLW